MRLKIVGSDLQNGNAAHSKARGGALHLDRQGDRRDTCYRRTMGDLAIDMLVTARQSSPAAKSRENVAAVSLIDIARGCCRAARRDEGSRLLSKQARKEN